MQSELPLIPSEPRPRGDALDWLRVGSQHLKLHLVPNRRAHRYILRLNPDGTARVTVPRGGSAAEARRFAERCVPWLEKQLLRQATRVALPRNWNIATKILFRGELVRIEPELDGATPAVRLGSERVQVRDLAGDLRPEIEGFLRGLAARDLAERTWELARLHAVAIQRVTVRNQRSRWGSCSRRGTISLNWRLVQTPPFVQDYIVLHELAHMKEMNHSSRFWREVARLCPGFMEAERWLKQHRELLA